MSKNLIKTIEKIQELELQCMITTHESSEQLSKSIQTEEFSKHFQEIIYLIHDFDIIKVTINKLVG